MNKTVLESMNSLVSIVMPVYNGEEFIREAIESVLNQQYSFIELLVVDDGSTDGTAKVAEELSGRDNRILYLHQPNSGTCSVPRNNGLSQASGEYITFFDADDIMLPQKLELQVSCLQRHEDVQAVFCDYRNFNQDGHYEQSHFDTCSQLKRLFDENGDQRDDSGILILDPVRATRLLAHENYTSACAPLFRKSIVDRIGGYDPSLKASEDWFFHMQVVSMFSSAVMPFVGFERRMHGNNMSSNSLKMLEYRAKTREMASHIVADPQTRNILQNQSALYWYELSKEITRKHQPGALQALLRGLRVHRRVSLEGVKALIKMLVH